MSDCPDSLHSHPFAGVVVFSGHALTLDQRVIALVPATTVAERITQLLERHGLADIEDDPANCTPWPAPDPAERIDK